MKTSLLFGKRRPAPADDAAECAGSDTEIDVGKTISDRALKTAIRPLVGEPGTQHASGTTLLFAMRARATAHDAAQYAGADTEIDTQKPSDGALKTSIRPLVSEPETRQAADGERRS